MSQITKCLDCQKDVSVTAAKCPHCGSVNFSKTKQAQNTIIAYVGVGVLAWITWMFYGNNIRLWLKIHFG